MGKTTFSRQRMLRSLLILPIALQCLLTTACVPVPVKQVKGVGGKAKEQDFTFVKEGQTTRAEVLEKLGWMDSGIAEIRLFWGRWTRYGWPWVAVGPQVPAMAVRSHKTQNLLIEFDKNGIASRFQLVEEGNIRQELLKWWRRSEPNPSTCPATAYLDVGRFDENGHTIAATLRLGADSIQLYDTTYQIKGDSIERKNTGIQRPFRISMSDISNINGPGEKSEDPGMILLSVSYRDGIDGREDIQLQISPRNFLTLLKFTASSDACIAAPWMPAPVLRAPQDGVVYDRPPRMLTLSWNTVPGAAAYSVQWEYGFDGLGASAMRDLPDYGPIVTGTSYTLELTGAAPVRWRVWPLDEEGRRGTPSEWRTFRYAR